MLTRLRHRARLIARTGLVRLLSASGGVGVDGASRVVKPGLRAQTDSRVMNPYSGIGQGGRDRSVSTSVAAPPVLDQKTLENAFEGSRLVRRIVRGMSEVAMSKGYQWRAPNADAQDVAALELQMRQHDFDAKLINCAGWANLYGACLLVPLYGDGLDASAPLTQREVDIVGLHVVDRYDISNIKYYGAEEPSLAGQPKSYMLRLAATGAYHEVHASRVYRLDGDLLPIRKRRHKRGFNASVIVGMWWSLVRVWTASAELSAMLSDSNVGVWKIKGFNGWISDGDEGSLQNWLDTQILYRGVLGDSAIDADDSFEFKSRSIKDSVEVFETLLFGLATEVNRPFTELFGRSPAGMNATGQSDTEKWHESIDSGERPRLAGALQWFAGLLANQPGMPSTLADVAVDWPALRQMTPEQEVDLEDKRTQTEERLVKMGALPVSAVTARLRKEGKYEIPDVLEDEPDVLPSLEVIRQGRLADIGGSLYLNEATANKFREVLGMQPWRPEDRTQYLANLEAMGGASASAGAQGDAGPRDVLHDSFEQVGVNCDGETGDGSKMLLAFRLPEALASQRPALDQDDSAPHVTFCYMPAVTNPAVVEAIVRPIIARHSQPHRATLGELEHLLGHDGSLVMYQRIQIKRRWKLIDLRDELITALKAHGIPVSFDDHWLPHLTLAYLPNHAGVYAGPTLSGSWLMNELELWGGQEVVNLPLGRPPFPGDVEPELLPAVEVSE